MQLPATPHAALRQPPKLRQARFEDFAQIARLEDKHNLISLPKQDWSRVWLDSPLWPRLGEKWPIGWVLEDEHGNIVGTHGNIPGLHSFRGQSLITATGRGCVVTPEYRGLALWLLDEFLNQGGVDLFFYNTVNIHGTGVVAPLCPRCPLGDWQAASFWVTAYHGFALTALKMKGVPLPHILAPAAAAALRLKHALTAAALPPPAQGIDVAFSDHFDDRFDVFWRELVSQNADKLLAVRDLPTLNWHYAIPLRAGKIWILTASRAGSLRAFCVLKREDQPPGFQGLTRIRLVDFQTLEPDRDLLTTLLRPALARCSVERIHVLEHMGCDLPRMRSFDRLAPHRRKLQSWKYYYKAADPALEAELANPQVWDPSTYDGDATID